MERNLKMILEKLLKVSFFKYMIWIIPQFVNGIFELFTFFFLFFSNEKIIFM